MNYHDFSRLMRTVSAIVVASNALLSPGLTSGVMQEIIDDLRQKLEDDKK